MWRHICFLPNIRMSQLGRRDFCGSSERQVTHRLMMICQRYGCGRSRIRCSVSWTEWEGERKRGKLSPGVYKPFTRCFRTMSPGEVSRPEPEGRIPTIFNQLIRKQDRVFVDSCNAALTPGPASASDTNQLLAQVVNATTVGYPHPIKTCSSCA